MAQTLWVTATGSGGLARALAPVGATFSLGGATDEYALEYDVNVQTPPIGATKLAFHAWNKNATTEEIWLPDQNGLTGDGDVTALLALCQGRWYRRVIRFIASGFTAASYDAWKLGLVTDGAGSVAAAFANVRVTSYRETQWWMWRETMAAPAIVSPVNVAVSNSLTSTGVTTVALLSQLCAKLDDTGLDDISHQRRTGGRLNSWMFWDEAKNGYRLTGIRLNQQQRDELWTYYQIYRREAVPLKLRANYPSELVRFERPPKFTDLVEAGKVTYETELNLLRR